MGPNRIAALPPGTFKNYGFGFRKVGGVGLWTTFGGRHENFKTTKPNYFNFLTDPPN